MYGIKNVFRNTTFPFTKILAWVETSTFEVDIFGAGCAQLANITDWYQSLYACKMLVRTFHKHIERHCENTASRRGIISTQKQCSGCRKRITIRYKLWSNNIWSLFKIHITQSITSSHPPTENGCTNRHEVLHQMYVLEYILPLCAPFARHIPILDHRITYTHTQKHSQVLVRQHNIHSR